MQQENIAIMSRTALAGEHLARQCQARRLGRRGDATEAGSHEGVYREIQGFHTAQRPVERRRSAKIRSVLGNA